MRPVQITIIGGDARLIFLAEQLAEKGYLILCFATAPISEHRRIFAAATLQEALQDADIIIGGIPFLKGQYLHTPAYGSKIELSEFGRFLKKGQKLFGGLLSGFLREICRANEVIYYDFMEDDPLAIFNAIATAEGSILVALKEQPSNLHGSQCLVLGYGRCGRVLADKLKGLSANVTICVRKESDLAYARAAGMNALSLNLLPQKIGQYEYIFNTIPSTILTENILKNLSKDSLIIDLASGQGGTDYKAADRLHIRALLCPGLPGQYAPKASAMGMAEFILKKLE